MGRFFTIIIFFVLSFQLTLAQQNNKLHSIQKGENIYSISKKYGVSVEAIYELNPGTEKIIYVGQILRIPNSNSSSDTSSSSDTNTDSNGATYVVKAGDTKFSLAKRFGVTIAELEKRNPHIAAMLQTGQILSLDSAIELPVKGTYLVKHGDTKYSLAKRFGMTIAQLEEKNPHIANMLMTGHVLNVGNSDLSNINEDSSGSDITPSENTVTTSDSGEDTKTTEDTTITSDKSEEQRYKDYVIQPKETLYSLAKKAGMSITAFTQLNPKLLTSVNAGDIIKMPIHSSDATTTDKDVTNTSDTAITTIENTSKNDALYADLETASTKGIYFYSPFSDNELSSPETRKKLLRENSNYAKYLEFFQGAQVAIDSALSLNLNFDISLIKYSDVDSTLNLVSTYEKNAILVPFLENNSVFPKLECNKELVVIDVESNIDTSNQNLLIKSIPSEDFQKTKTLNYLAKKDGQVIVVSETEKAKNKNLISSIIPNALFLKVDNAGFFKENTLEKALDKNKTNYIILDSEKTIVFLNSTTELMSKLSDFNIQLVIINASLIPEKNQVSDMRYRVLRLIFPTILNSGDSTSKTNFEVTYAKLFKQDPSRYAILGFDTTLDMLLRLSQNKSFEDTINSTPSKHSNIKFDFKKMKNKNYSNTALYLMQYKANEGMIKLED